MIATSLILCGGIGLAVAAKLGIVARTKTHRFDRRQLSNGQRPQPGTVTGAITSIGVSQAQVVYPTNIVVASSPAYQLNGVAPTAVTSPSSGTFLLTYAATIATKTLVIPSNDPAIRTPQGGYATAQSKTF